MTLRKTQSLIVDDLKPEPRAEEKSVLDPDDHGDICTPEAEPSTDDDQPLA